MKTMIQPHNDFDHAAPQKVTILPRKSVLKRVGLSNSSVHEMIRQGQFPAPIQLSARRVGWLEDEIDAWLAARVAASRITGA